MIDAEPVVPGPGDARNKQMVSAITASVLGWSLDLFDLFILLYVAPTVGKLFFPSSQPTLSLAAVYASFAVTLLMRPLGSAIFGHMADLRGRKRAMLIAIMGVGIATACFGLLPTIAQVGAVAPVLFILLRLVQGVFVGGVVASTHTIGTESVPQKYRGAMSGLIGGGGAAVGALLSSIVFLIASTLFAGPAFETWGWRFMFFTGLLSSGLGLFIFSNLEESPLWQQLRAAKAAKRAETAAHPIRTLFSSQYRGTLFVNVLITFGGGAGYYLSAGYLPAFLKLVNHVAPGAASLILMTASVAAFVSAVAMGALSEAIGRKKTFILLGASAIILLPLCYMNLGRATDLTTIALLACAIAFIGNMTYAPVLIFLNERFPTAMRATGTGVSWNVGFALGGMMPTLVSLVSPTPADIPSSLAYCIGGVFVVYLIGAFIIPETKGKLVQ